jgi:tetratricopeptide (TPR) repeat protein
MADKRYVFLSYGRRDVYPQGATNAVEQEAHFPIVEKVYRFLYGLRDSTGLEPWFDKLSLTHDRQFTDSINQAIEQSDYMLLFIGKHSMGSEWCEREWKHALANCVPVIPILLEGGWGDADIQTAYPETIRYVDGIDPKGVDGKLDENHLLSKIVNVIQQKPAPLATARGARKLPEHYIERKQYVDALKKELGVNDKNYAQRKNIVGITSQQETAALQGIGGIGKTTLALAVCADCEVRRGFDQIFWLEAGPQTQAEDAARLMQIIGTQMGDSAENYKDVQSARASLHRYLNGKRSLLVLDDVWAEGLVDQFSWAGADCRLLVTTRNKSLVEHPQQVAKLGTEEGLRLLATIFDPLNPDVSQLNDEHKAIVTMLDGYTLAIAIAGKWLMKYGQQRAGTYLSRLQAGESDLFKQLEMSKSDKNANLELSLSLSYNDLDPDDQQRFRALGIFAVGSSFSQAALDAVWGLEDGFMETQHLVDVGLLEVVKGTHDDERFSQHNLLRAYAKALMEKTAESDALFERYADFYTELANQFDELLPEDWGVLDDDLPHIHAVGDEMVKRTNTGQSGDLERALAFSDNTISYLNKRRQIQRINWTQMGLNSIQTLKFGASKLTLKFFLRHEASFLHEMGAVTEFQGNKHDALILYQRALNIRRDIGDKLGEATTLNNIGALKYALGIPDEALEFYQESLIIRKELGDERGEAICLNNIGMIVDDLGDKHKALEVYEQALKIRRKINDKQGEAASLNNIGSLKVSLGEKQEALNLFHQSLVLLIDVRDERGRSSTLNNIGWVFDVFGEPKKSLEYYYQALSISETLGDPDGIATTLSNIGASLVSLNDMEKAIDYYRQALIIQKQTKYQSGEAATLNNIAGIYYLIDEYDLAIDFFKQALSIQISIGDVASQATTNANMSWTYKGLGRWEDSLAKMQEAIAILEHYELLFDSAGRSTFQHEAILKQWEIERSGSFTEAEQIQVWVETAKKYQQRGEAWLRMLLNQAGGSERQIRQILASMKRMDKP